MKNLLLEEQQKSEKIAILREFIHSNPDARELKRALAIKMALQGEPYSRITRFLSSNKSFITRWTQKFEAEGLDGIKLGYQGASSYLTPQQRCETLIWLRAQEYCHLDELVTYLDETYGVVYKSKQSYYELLSVAKISWKKSQKTNPSFNPDLVKNHSEEIIDFLTRHQAEIEAGRLVVLFVDQCHLLANDVCGYVWGKTNIRIEMTIKNIKDRQTYIGALDYQTHKFLVHEYPAGNSSSTKHFIEYLQNQYPGQRIVLIWDGASYHRASEIKEFLASVNADHEPEKWPITCIRFAPNAPEQNPVEDVWLQAKNFLRKFWPWCKSFSVIKWLFKFFTNYQEFDFPKLHQYTPYSNLN